MMLIQLFTQTVTWQIQENEWCVTCNKTYISAIWLRILCGQLLAVRRGGAGEALADGADGALADTAVCLPRISRVAELQDKSGLLSLCFPKHRLDVLGFC